MLFPQSVPASNHHNGYTSGTEDCPFRVEAMPILPAAAIFPHPVHTSVAALVPEWVMVRTVGHWSNTTSLV
jgi:hypothetical protein